MTDRQTAILAGIYRDLQDLSARTPQYAHGDMALVREREAIADAQAGLVKGNPSKWLGLQMTASLYVMVSRDYATLDRRGLIERHALGYDPRRTTHLALTEAGEAEARRLLAAEGGEP